MLAHECGVHLVDAAASLSILPTDSGYLNDNSFYYVVGEVQNTGDTAVTDVNVSATFYNSTGETVAEIRQPTKLSTILPNRTSPFEITLFSTVLSSTVHNYTVQIVTFSPAQDRPLGLKILSNSSSSDANGYRVTGTIENIGTQSTSFTRLIVTFYDTTGHAIATIANDSTPSYLVVNQDAAFNILLNSSVASQVHNYVLEAESYDYESVPEFQPMLFMFTFLTLTTTVGLTAKRLLKRKHAGPKQTV
jgi:phosphotransferase system IIB component